MSRRIVILVALASGLLAAASLERPPWSAPSPPPPPAPAPQPATEVLAVHLSFADTSDAMTAQWHTDGLTGAASAYVRWRHESTMLRAVARGQSDSYLVSESGRLAFVHHAVMTNLVPGETYVYAVGHEGGPEGEEYRFTMRSADMSGRAKVLIFGDTGNSEKWSKDTVPTVAAEVAAGGVSAIVHTGDMAYYAKGKDGQAGGLHAEELSNSTGHTVPLMTVPGNAEVFCYRPAGIPDWATCTQDYQRRYIMPGWNRSHSLWSSFSVGLVRFLLLDSEAQTWCAGSQSQPDQRTFLEAELSSVDRAVTPWVVAVVHRPFYSSCENVKEQTKMRDGFWDLLTKYAVDVVFSGHVHSYERTWPVTGDYNTSSNATIQRFADAGSYVDPSYPVQIVSGAAGNGEGVNDCDKGAAMYGWTFSAFRSSDIGYSRLWSHNATHLELDFFSVSQKTAIDHVWVVRSASPAGAAEVV